MILAWVVEVKSDSLGFHQELSVVPRILPGSRRRAAPLDAHRRELGREDARRSADGWTSSQDESFKLFDQRPTRLALYNKILPGIS